MTESTFVIPLFGQRPSCLIQFVQSVVLTELRMMGQQRWIFLFVNSNSVTLRQSSKSGYRTITARKNYYTLDLESTLALEEWIWLKSRISHVSVIFCLEERGERREERGERRETYWVVWHLVTGDVYSLSLSLSIFSLQSLSLSLSVVTCGSSFFVPSYNKTEVVLLLLLVVFLCTIPNVTYIFVFLKIENKVALLL